MKNVLIITHYFPPRPGIGSVRLGGLVKYLPEFGWHPIVLTSKLPHKPSGNFTLIETPAFEDTFTKWKRRLGFDPEKGFKEQTGATDNIDRKTAKAARKFIELCKGILAYPDECSNWYGAACDYARKALKDEHVDVILSSSSPVTTHLIASFIKKESNVPWVADLRDLWTQNHYYSYGVLRKHFERRLELRTLKVADALVTVSEPLSRTLGLLHKKKRIYAITNGFDPDEHEAVPLTRDFTITYTGQLYEGKRDPSLFLTAIRELIDDGVIDKTTVRIRFLGPKAPWLATFVNNSGLDQIVHFDHLDRSTALRMQAESQILLLLNWDDPKEKGVYTGKLFEYLGAKRPIISIGGFEGVLSELLAETKAGIFCGNDTDKIKKVLLPSYRDYVQHGAVTYQGKKELIDNYTHRQMAEQFSKVLSVISI